MRISEKTPEDIAREQAEQEKQEARQYARLEELASLTNQQIDNYIDTNMANLPASAREGFKKLAKWNRALTKALL